MIIIFNCLLLIYFLFNVHSTISKPTEEERVRQWYLKGNTWPPIWQNETIAMKQVLHQRELEILSITGADERFSNYMQFVQQRLVPKFTTKGFEVIAVPSHIMKKLLNAVKNPLKDFKKIKKEEKFPIIYHNKKKPPKFIDLGKLATEVMYDLLPLHEEWSGLDLIPTSSYGVRFYQNSSSLVAHYDRIATHAISSIIHIAHQYDNEDEPWPIEIEDHDGNWHKVNLEPGQMLFYESAKCLHGRLSKLKGKYYGSIFVHYKPKDKTVWDFTDDDIIANIPPHWNMKLQEEKGQRFAGTAITIDSRVSSGAPKRSKYVKNPHIPIYEDNINSNNRKAFTTEL